MFEPNRSDQAQSTRKPAESTCPPSQDRFRGVIDLVLASNATRRYSDDSQAAAAGSGCLLANTMSPAFLNQVAAPRIHNSALDLIELWHLKIKLAGNHPFFAYSDIHHMAWDAIWATTFGTSSGTTKSQLTFLSSLDKLEALSPDENILAKFPKGPTPPMFNAIITMIDSLDNIVGSPQPRWYHWLIRQTPSYRAAKKYKDEIVDECFRSARKQHSDDPDDQKDARCAVENVLQREASKEGRVPQFDSPIVKDDLFGFIVAGHETTTSTVTWSIKYLADNPQVQHRLRAILRTELPEAAAARTVPCAEDIVKREIPYLDAVIEEILRCTQTNGAIRKAKVDTEVLGYHIPAETDVYMLSNGPSFMSPGFEIEESRRSPSSQANNGKNGGPHLAFGLGPRGCFGKKLAYTQLRIMIVLVVWEFELKKVPPELSGYGAAEKLTRRPQQCFVRLGFVQD